MPKINNSKSTLSKARELLRLTNMDSDFEESSSSDDSEEYSQIPIQTEIPTLDSLFIDNPNPPESLIMEQFASEMTKITQMLQ